MRPATSARLAGALAACMALAPVHADGAIGAASGPAADAYSPALLQEAYGLSSAAAHTPSGTETVAVF
jgi:hypothetical protein